MMTATPNLSPSVKRCIDDHLDAIDASLRNSGLTRSERQNILDDVETQIHEMLGARAPSAPTVEDARAVLAEMDPPESYTGEEKSASTDGPNKDNGWIASGKLALWLSLGCLVPTFIVTGLQFTSLLRIGMVRPGFVHVAHSPLVCYFTFLFLMCQIAAFVFGRMAKSRPMGKAAYRLAGATIISVIILAVLTLA